MTLRCGQAFFSVLIHCYCYFMCIYLYFLVVSVLCVLSLGEFELFEGVNIVDLKLNYDSNIILLAKKLTNNMIVIINNIKNTNTTWQHHSHESKRALLNMNKIQNDL